MTVEVRVGRCARCGSETALGGLEWWAATLDMQPLSVLTIEEGWYCGPCAEGHREVIAKRRDARAQFNIPYWAGGLNGITS